jgi:hypothetical protein
VVAHRLQGAASPFGPYIANLPLGVAGLPMFFGGEALAELQYPPVSRAALLRSISSMAFNCQSAVVGKCRAESATVRHKLKSMYPKEPPAECRDS